jgi:uncharacterized protein
MLILLSPAKSLNLEPAPDAPPASAPRLASHTAALADVTRTLSRADLRRLMDISEPLADLNYQRFQAFDAEHGAQGMPAALAFNGDVYHGLDARNLERADLDYAQAHVRILSGLYGLLRPLDAIQPYRLEMGTALATPRGSTLYAFWGPTIAEQINQDLEGRDIVVNLASQEYFGAVDTTALRARVVTPVFREVRDGKARIISFYAKRARGLMARHAIKARLQTAEGLKSFTSGGYRYDPEASSEDLWVFSRLQP